MPEEEKKAQAVFDEESKKRAKMNPKMMTREQMKTMATTSNQKV